jgi:hypothetical protein
MIEQRRTHGKGHGLILAMDFAPYVHNLEKKIDK